MKKGRGYPIGIQTFEVIREEGWFYVDKTEYVHRLAHGQAKYVFLSRPRRFGKSLLVSTLKSYFEGRKDLFEGLAIADLEKEWTEYPVLHFSMASGKHMEREQLELYLGYQLEDQEKRFGIMDGRQGENNRMGELIKAAYRQTGQKVVVLIDEYDAPLLDVVHEDEQLPVLRNVMRNFYSPLKDCDPYLRFVFLTGITKFSQMSIFSELNNISNISLDDAYAGICGITREEMLTQMSDSIDDLAEKNNFTREEAIERLTKMYDGYHFSGCSPDIFNPFSLLNCFADKKLNAYWFGSGTPTYLIEMMRKFGVVPSEFKTEGVDAADFDAATETMSTLTPLLYQSGYVTIKDYDPDFQAYTLDIPNNEVRVGLMRSLIPHFVLTSGQAVNSTVIKLMRCVVRDDMDEALRILQTFLSTVPQCDNTNYEGHWQQVLYIIFSIMGNYCDVEVHTATGRVDMVMATKTRLYIVETKIDRSADAALAQINLNDYAKRFALSPLPRVKVGINFDTKTHTLADWRIEE